VVIAVTLPFEPYTGRRIEFRKAAATKVQIDHLYPLARAWDMGAAGWLLLDQEETSRACLLIREARV
jgi:hypothetical protein